MLKNMNSSAARILMQGLGQVSKMTGMAIISLSVIYVMKYMLIFGCCSFGIFATFIWKY
jgi:hypothetical protein